MTSEPARQLYVADLPADVTEEFLKEFFGEVGTVESIELKSDRTDRRGKPICYAFVTYERHDDAKRAIVELNYTKVNGVPIRLAWSDAEARRIRKSGKGILFIKNLDPAIDMSQLHDILGEWGEIIFCKIATDAEGKSLGYGCVQFRDEKDADQAMQGLKEATINGRPVQIEPYQKRQRPNPE